MVSMVIYSTRYYEIFIINMLQLTVSVAFKFSLSQITEEELMECH